jgi:hypothetical protein
MGNTKKGVAEDEAALFAKEGITDLGEKEKEGMGINDILVYYYAQIGGSNQAIRIYSLRAMMIITSPFSGIKLPKRPGYAAIIEAAKNRYADISHGESSLNALILNDGRRDSIADRMYLEKYEDELTEAVMQSIGKLVKAKKIKWENLRSGMVIPTTDGEGARFIKAQTQNQGYRGYGR